MDTTRDIETSTKTLIDNLCEEYKWNDKLLKMTDLEEFKTLLLERSDVIRRFYVENEECIEKLRAYCNKPMDLETADALFLAARAMVMAGRLDSELIVEICEPAISFYMAEEMDERAIIVAAIRNACLQDYYGRMRPEEVFDVSEQSYQWIISKKDDYAKYTDIRARHNIFHSYTGIIMLYVRTGDEDKIYKAIDYFIEANKFWESEVVQEIDGNEPSMIAIIEDMNNSIPFEIDFDSDDFQATEKAVEFMGDFCKAHAQSGDWGDIFLVKLLESRQKEFHHKITPLESVKEISELVKTLPEPDWEGDIVQSQKIFWLFSNAYIMAMKAMTRAELTKDERAQEVIQMLRQFHDLVEKQPYSFLTSYVNDVYQEMFKVTLPNLSEVELIERLINEMIIMRQPSTYFHSQMVKKISIVIAKEMIKEAPELFVGIPGYDDVETVLQKKQELLRFIAKGAELHDIGKCGIAEIVMRQSRKLVDDEFLCIKAHPDMGRQSLKDKSEFDMYADIIRGHHKTYDGTYGYPYDFDHTKSPYRIVIELIAICDATDAATDITGRNYTKGKDFSKLLGELQEGAGTRYHPDIVRIISESPAVIEKLTKLTGEERMGYCYEAYRKCMKIK